ncbi:MAG: hypothetical protein IT204_09140 [Fimbriimonadaceae bacterium]|nr:hypothetical protein [Fimbriimonadaceae bacterium]
MELIAALQTAVDEVRSRLDQGDRAREASYRLQRDVTRAAASSIRAAHRGDLAEAARHLAECGELTAAMNAAAQPAGEVYYGGFLMDAQKEYAEAALVLAFVSAGPLPTAASLGIEAAPYLNGLAEAAGELRRATLDALQRHDQATAQQRVELLDAIYFLLVTFDYPDAVTYGLKRRLDMVRAVLERTQSDVLTTSRQQSLQAAIERLEQRLGA